MLNGDRTDNSGSACPEAKADMSTSWQAYLVAGLYAHCLSYLNQEQPWLEDMLKTSLMVFTNRIEKVSGLPA